MLLEITNLRQYLNEGLRRCFRSADFNLVVWTSHDHAIVGFEIGFEIGYVLGRDEGRLKHDTDTHP